ncbi:MAG: hypothetical protein DRP82_07400 [Planctomycetota bacterium]|nr:MAG: hypothetical protein DRP82_07400 [Planctomycetota bacterium]
MRTLCTILFVVLGLLLFGQESVSERIEAKNAQQLRLFKKISLLNLINGLHMSKEQMRRVYDLNLQLEAERVEHYFATLKVLSYVESVRRRLYEELLLGKQSDEWVREAAKTDRMLRECRNRGYRCYEQLAPKVEEVFTDAQKEIINTFDPCTVPPRDMRNPIRAGQAPSQEKIFRALRRLRDMPAWRQRRAIQLATDRHIRSLKEHTNLTPEEEQRERQRFQKLLQKIASMDDVEFELKKHELVNELVYGSPVKAIKEKKKQLERLGREIGRTGQKRYRYSPKYNRVVRFFLDPPVVIPVLRDKMGIAEKVKAESEEAFKKVESLMQCGKLKEAFRAALEVAKRYPCTPAAKKALDCAENIARKTPDVVSSASLRK